MKKKLNMLYFFMSLSDLLIYLYLSLICIWLNCLYMGFIFINSSLISLQNTTYFLGSLLLLCFEIRALTSLWNWVESMEDLCHWISDDSSCTVAAVPILRSSGTVANVDCTLLKKIHVNQFYVTLKHKCIACQLKDLLLTDH